MEVGIVTIVLVVLVIWYFGSSINAIVSGSGEMAADEFAVFRRDQKIRLHKSRIHQTKTLDDIKDTLVYSDDEFDKIFDVIRGDSDDGKSK